MMEQIFPITEVEEGSRRAGKAIIQPEFMTEHSRWKASREVKRELCKGMQQRWEAQWQEFLQTLQAPDSAWGNPQPSEAAPWDDAKAFLASFEQVAEACRWPRGEWVARLMPALGGEAQQAFSLLEAGDKEDYGKVKAAILRGDALRREAQRQHFRRFCCPELEDPRRMHSRLQELCCQWLKPERHTKEQILELLVLEQFVASLPVDVQSWVRAGGPDSCAQAVALLEDFLLSQGEVKTRTWQGPLQEERVGSLEPLDTVHKQTYKDTKQNGNRAISFSGSPVPCPSHSSSSLPPKEQEMAEAGLTEGLINFREAGVKSLHVAEQTSAEPSQQTMFWKVLEDNGENVDSLEGLLFPKPELASPLEKEEESLCQFSVEPERLSAGNKKRSPLKLENSLLGENEPEEMPRTVPRTTKGNVLVTAELHKERCESNRGQGKEPLAGQTESSNLMEGLSATCSEPSRGHTGGEKPLFSMYGRRYNLKSRFYVKHTGEDSYGCPILGENFQHQRRHTGEKPRECCKYEESSYRRASLQRQHSSPSREEHSNCLKCGKSFTSESFWNHLRIHTADQVHKCPECGKLFRYRAHLKKHLRSHTGEKRYQCTECGKKFFQKSHLLRHQNIHTGEKPYKCPDCGKSFSQRSNLLRHEMIHTGKKPHQCSECGKIFSWRSSLLMHQNIHTGKKPHKCPECGKSFYQRSDLLRHQNIHTGEKPHKCPTCGKSFSRRTNLLAHQKIHTGKKPHQCPACGKSYSQRVALLRHQNIHTGEKPYKCS